MALLPTPNVFDAFPYAQPYAIQLDLMKTVYETIEKRQVAVLESPTGTGKSLSVLCSSLQWIIDNADRPPAPAIPSANSDEPSWLTAFVPAVTSPIVLPKPPPRAHAPPPPPPSVQITKRPKLDTTEEDLNNNGDDDSAHLLEDITAEPETDVYVDELVAKTEDHLDDGPHVQKIYYCSRTHSQLTQFLGELRRTKLASLISVVTLGSRKNLCINDKVAKPGRSASQINDSCLEIQRKHKAKAKHKGCKFLDPRTQQSLIHVLQSQVIDIEEAAAVGRLHQSCPYYGTRASVPVAQLVVLPYQMLLHAKTRSSLGIKLKEQIVIIDEAHNLIDTLGDLYSSSISLAQATEALSNLQRYHDRYKSRLLSLNRNMLQILQKVLRAFIWRMQQQQEAASSDGPKEMVLSLPQFWEGFQRSPMPNVENVNLFEICNFIEKSQLSRKLNGFIEMADQQQQTHVVAIHPGADDDARPASAMHSVEAFIQALTNVDKDGRVLVQHGLLRFLLLNPARPFADIIAESRAVILLGGTMKPLNEFQHMLFPQIAVERFRSFECGHVVPATSVLALSISSGPSNKPIQLVMDNRTDTTIIDDIGNALVALAQTIPDGLVCFFQKFDYVESLVQRWQVTGCWAKLMAAKKVFREPRMAAAVEGTLTAYAECITNGQGAMLLCVINGKMSEGINFKDKMGRGVVVAGLPYANKHAPALKAKIDYLNSQYPRRGDEYYENLCMKAVNQSIGRAIRHRDDHAVIVLMDRRFNDKTARLPGWIAQSLVQPPPSSFNEAMTHIKLFFDRMKDKK